GLDMAGGEDFTFGERPMWTLNGAPAPFAPNLAADRDADRMRARAYAAPPGHRYAAEFLRNWRRAPADADYRIPVERIAAPLLLVSAEDDGLWPSRFGAECIVERMERAGGAAIVRHVSLGGCGHAIGMPNEPRPFSNIAWWSDGYAGVQGGFVDYGGAPDANAAGAREGWREAVAFLRDVL
ncbi:MAG: acyl-CoA thioester hydrolase/BAAT C-terminal domain-containing protein, partial [Pseudomonadota bacterium]